MKIFNYIQYTKNNGIKIQKGMNLKVYVKADYAGDLNTKKSTFGFLMMLGIYTNKLVFKTTTLRLYFHG